MLRSEENNGAEEIRKVTPTRQCIDNHILRFYVDLCWFLN